MSKEAIKLALEEMKIGNYNSAAERLEAALAEQPAQPQQEPEWYHFVRHGRDCFVPYEDQVPKGATALYTSPPAQRKPLADGQMEVSVRYKHSGSELSASKQWNEAWCLRELDRIVANDIYTIRKQIEEAAHGIKEQP